MNTDKFEPPRTIKCQNTFYIYLISYYLQSTDEVGGNFISFESELRILEFLNELNLSDRSFDFLNWQLFKSMPSSPNLSIQDNFYFFQVRKKPSCSDDKQ